MISIQRACCTQSKEVYSQRIDLRGLVRPTSSAEG